MTRTELKLPEGFIFLFSFDFFSVFERKNPLGLVEAFRRAFPASEGPTLVIKSINGEKKLADLERLRHTVRDRRDIMILDGYVSPSEKNAMMAAADCYVSLHRSEGLGLTMAEAMGLGKPVIATGYSGNLAFMDETNSHLVRYDLASIPEGCDPYPPGGEWADPDLDHAAELMRRVYKDPEEAQRLGDQAQRDLAERHSIARTADFMEQRLSARPRHERMFREIRGPLERAAAAVWLSPGKRLEAASKGKGPRAMLRRLLHKALWPELEGQRSIDASVVEALRALERVSHTAFDRIAELEPRAEAQEYQLASLIGSDGDRLREVEKGLASLQRWPYTSDEWTLRTTDSQGRPVIGYEPGDFQTPREQGVYRGFEEIFRGHEEFIRNRQRYYLDIIGSRKPVLDVGCGRGEFLDLLRERRIPAFGVDIDEAMVARCREKGHSVERVDANTFLEKQPDNSLGVVFSAQVVEHLEFDQLTRLLQLSREKLMPEGLFVAETVNPHSLAAFKTFWVDLTHKVPMFPEVAVAMCGLSGYDSAFVVFPNGSKDLERDRLQQGEYAVVARR
jgi:SAM-dependent methyltransferase